MADQRDQRRENYVRRHAKASSSASTSGGGTTLATISRSFAGRNASIRGAGSGARSSGRSRLLLLAALAALAALALIPASASALLTRPPEPFSPITAASSGYSFNVLMGIAVDESNGNLAVGNGFGGNNVLFFSATGGHPVGVASPYQIEGFHFFGSPPGMAIDNSSPPSVSKGALYVTDTQNFESPPDAFQKYVRNPVTEKYELAGSLHPSSGPAFSQPVGGVVVNKSGDVFVSDQGSQSVLEFSPAGVEIARVSTAAAVGAPSTLAMDAAGDLFVGQYPSGRVVKYASADLGPGDINPPFTEVEPASSNAKGLAVDLSSDTLFVGLGNHIQEFNATTLAKATQFGAGFIYEASSLAVNSSTGRIYVADHGFPTQVEAFGALVTLADVTTGGAPTKTGTRATVEGVINPQNVALTGCKFEYGTSPSYGNSVPCEGTVPTDTSPHTVTAKLANLQPNGVKYHYRLVATNANGSNSGADQEFQTPNTVETGGAVAQAGGTALLKGSVNPDTVPITECKFEITKETDWIAKQFSGAKVVPCEQSPGSGEEAVEVTAVVEGLAQSTDYTYRLVAANANGTIFGAASENPLSTKGPQIKNTFVSYRSITSNSAVLVGVVNAEGEGAAYHFEYVTQADYEQSGYADAKSVPSGTAGIGHGSEDVIVEPTFGGLSPETRYHARLVLTNPSGTVMSKGLEFGTFPAESLASCPNEELREGHPLPDCRAYEQVSPEDKNGDIVKGEEDHVQASADGSSIIYLSKSGIPGGEGEQIFPQYVSRRGPSGWTTHGTLPNPLFGIRNTTRSWSDDLNLAFNIAGFFPAGGTHTESVAVMHDTTTGENTQLWSPKTLGAEFNLIGVSSDDQTIYFESEQVFPGVIGPQPVSGVSNIYRYDRETGELTVAGLQPESDGGGVPTAGAWTDAEYRYTQDQNFVSNDGDKVFFWEQQDHYSGKEEGRVFMRTGLDGDSPETIEISKSKKENGLGPEGVESNSPAPAAFQTATPDGKYAYLISPEELTNEANTGPEPVEGVGRSDLAGANRNYSFLPQAGARWIAVDSGHVYWSNEKEGKIGRAEIGGGNPNPNFITGLDHPKGVAVDASHIYWAETRDGAEGNGSIGRAEINGTNPNSNFITGAGDPHGVAVSAGFIYWANGDNTNIGRATIAGASPEQSFIHNFGEVPWGIAVNASGIFYDLQGGQYNYMVETSLAGAQENFRYIGQGGVRQVALDAGHVYWANTGERAVGRMQLDFENQNPTFVSEIGGIVGVAVDAGHIYWAVKPAQSLGSDLYAYQTETGELTDLTVDNGDLNGAQAVGVAGVSDDGSVVYFAANGDLDGGGPATTGNCGIERSGISGECGLYVWNNGTISYIAKVAAPNIEFTTLGGQRVSSEVAENGSAIVFSSSRNLTSYDSEGTTEFYRYDLASQQIQCVTCSPTGAPPAYTPVYGSGPSLSSWPAEVSTVTAAVKLRNLSANGDRFFFETNEKLVPEDINGDAEEEEAGREGQVQCKLQKSIGSPRPTCQDVYEWEADGSGSCTNAKGCFYLLSGGDTGVPAFFGDAGANGDDAYIFTYNSLVPQDRDQLQDVYDVRVDGGLKSQHPENPPPCEGDGCRNAFTPTPPVNGAGTAVLEGPENPAPVHKCPKGLVKQHGECFKPTKKHHAKKHHHGKRHHRHANKNGGSNR
jgi:hypothetical protein